MYRSNNNDADKGRWRDNNHYERHYCAICNVWMASDRASILTHENGKKHLDKKKEQQAAKSAETSRQNKQQAALNKSLQQMESAAASTMQKDYALFAGTAGALLPPSPPMARGPVCPVAPAAVPSRPVPPPPSTPSSSSMARDGNKKDWDALRRKREAEKKKKRAEENGDNNNGDDSGDDEKSSKRRKVKIGKDEGHYLLDGQTWLEGIVFGDMLEPDMPIQVWLGHAEATEAELRLPHHQCHWRNGVVAAVRLQRKSAVTHAGRMVVDVAYLESETDNDEKLIKSIPLRRIRILLGNKSDQEDRIPDTLLEARLLAMGGEEIVVKQEKDSSNGTNVLNEADVDEATGLSGWSTVRIKRTTERSERRDERHAERRAQQAARKAAEKVRRESEARQMEETKVSNANDSALGAYDVWSRTTTGYKGVDIHAASVRAVEVSELGKKLADGKTNVGFKKKKVKKKPQNRRTTSADD